MDLDEWVRTSIPIFGGGRGCYGTFPSPLGEKRGKKGTRVITEAYIYIVFFHSLDSFLDCSSSIYLPSSQQSQVPSSRWAPQVNPWMTSGSDHHQLFHQQEERINQIPSSKISESPDAMNPPNLLHFLLYSQYLINRPACRSPHSQTRKGNRPRARNQHPQDNQQTTRWEEMTKRWLINNLYIQSNSFIFFLIFGDALMKIYVFARCEEREKKPRPDPAFLSMMFFWIYRFSDFPFLPLPPSLFGEQKNFESTYLV